jgi:hypothetical protein
MEALLQPTLSAPVQSLFRCAYGVLLILTLAQTATQARRFFVSDRWGGYAQSDRRVDLVQNPFALPVVLGAWMTCALLITVGRWSVAASFVNLLLCRYFFVAMRWKGVLRGMGAPGFMTYWCAACVFFLEYGAAYDPTGAVGRAAVFTFRLDFAAIMLCAGTYKWLAGYARNDGMELGMINPWWGYWGSIYGRLRPSHWIFRTLNHLAYLTEIVAGILMLIPPTQLLGALLIFGSFVFIALHIRLGFLCEMVMLCCLLYVHPTSTADGLLAAIAPAPPGPGGLPAPAWLNLALCAGLYGYAALLPLAKLGLYYTFLARRRLPGPLQLALEWYTNAFGIIIWRVFSADHTNFWARIWFQDRARGARVEAARFGALDPARGFRYDHVGEFICLVSLFTTLKYYASESPLFPERVLRYSRTLGCPAGSDVVFEYMRLRKDRGRFESVAVAEYVVDVRAGTITERLLDDAFSPRAAGPGSPVRRGVKPGSYVAIEETARARPAESAGEPSGHARIGGVSPDAHKGAR